MIVDTLARTHLFEGVSPEYLQTMISQRTEVNLSANEYLFHQGDVGKGMYIILEGLIEVVLEPKDTDIKQVIATMEPGNFIGEVCILEPQTRTASVRSKGNAKLLYLDTANFLQHIEDRDPDALRISHNIALTLTQRLKRANEIVSKLSEPETGGKGDKENDREVSKYKKQLLSEVLF